MDPKSARATAGLALGAGDVRRIRLVGGWLTLVGGTLCVFAVPLFLASDARIRCNGVLTDALGCKVAFTALAAALMVTGIVVLLGGRRWMQRRLAATNPAQEARPPGSK